MSKLKPSLSDTLREEFQKDLELFKYFLLLLNDSSPIRNVELMWADEPHPVALLSTEPLNTGAALVQLQVGRSAPKNRKSPSTVFCDYVHGFGAHEETTCARSDNPAKERCRASGRSQVYPCHVGLTDIAVPVTCDGIYLGTLFSGQVLAKPATKEGFLKVCDALAGQAHIDFSKLETSYYEVPVVTQTELSEMVHVLELFARYIANSWKRLEVISNFQRIQDRELALNRKQLALLLLSGEVLDAVELNTLATAIGLKRIPDWVLVLRIKQSTPKDELNSRIADYIVTNRLADVVEEVCYQSKNTLVISIRPGEFCIFSSEQTNLLTRPGASMQQLAESLLLAVRARGISEARVGVSGQSADPQALLRAYQEASVAVESGTSPIVFFKELAPRKMASSESLAPVVRAIQKAENVDAAVHEFLAGVLPVASGIHIQQQMQQARAFVTWASEHLALEIVSLGADALAVNSRKEQHIREMLHAPKAAGLYDAFRSFALFLAEQVAFTFSEREDKIVFTVSQIIEERGVAQVTIKDLASALHLSSGHLSRVYSRTTGTTLESYLVRQRVELSKRMLLDPRMNVAEVADQCGFCNPAYFASVFKKYMNCTPREFANQPSRWKSQVAPSAQVDTHTAQAS